MIILALMAGVIILMSFLCGTLVSHWIGCHKHHHHFVTPLGYTVLLGILQLMYYPIQLLNLKTKWIMIATYSVYAIILLFSIIFYKCIIQQIKRMLKNWPALLLGMIFVVVLIGIYYFVKFPTRTDDLYFYIPYIAKKVESTHVLASKFSQYDFQGFYDFTALQVTQYNMLVEHQMAQPLLPIGVIAWVNGIVMFWILSFCIMDIMCYIKNKSNTFTSYWIALTLAIYSIGAYWYLQTPYIGNSFRRVSIVVIIALFLMYFKERKNSILVILFLSITSIVAQTSTGFFLVAFLLYAFVFYEAKNKKYYFLRKSAFLALPLAFFISLYEPMAGVWLQKLYLIYLVVTLIRLDKWIEKLLHKIYLPLMILIPIGLGIYTRLPSFQMPIFNMSYFEIKPDFFDPHRFEGIVNLFAFSAESFHHILISLFCVLCWIAIVWYIIKNIRHNDFIAFYVLTVFITFFNPWVITFVMTYLTSVVYFRIYDLFFNILTLFVFFNFLLLSFPKVPRYLCALVMMILFSNTVLDNQTWIFMKNSDDFNAIYHVNELEINVLNRFYKEVLHNSKEQVIVASQIYSTEAFTEANVKNVKANLYTYGDDDSDEAVFQRIFYRYEIGLEEMNEHFDRTCELAYKKGVQYIIVEAQYNPFLEYAIGNCSTRVLEEKNYRIFRMNEEVTP